ncbi:CaiB/BaiF CoA transferase family protein [Lentibacillus saliphilus]|uniref:CaiB/BaiF CoA transferase family protein n=1 Tax=Lentibacillus saliphilus TaxID=2737028 RepID=UPI001C308978
MSGPLEGIKILDLSRVLAGPYCTMILGDLGADVIKVEAPGGSDDTRKWGPPFQNDVSAYYLCANRNKRSITVNLKTQDGIETIKALAAESDVIINNFKSGAMTRFGLGYDRLKEINPKLIDCTITGFGETGPKKDLPGYDYIIQAMSGFMSITGDEQSGPQKMGVAIADILTGLYACIGIQAALIERTQSGTGQKLDLSLYDSAVSALVNIGSNHLMSGRIPKPLGNQHANIVPYQTFDTQDGEMVIAVGNDGQFKALCTVIERLDMAEDERYRTNPARVKHRTELTSQLQDIFATKPTAYWEKLCRDQNIPCGPIQNLAEVTQDPQLKAREMFIEQHHPVAGRISMIGSPLKLSRTPVTYRHHPPEPGEHNDLISKKENQSETDYS